MYENVQVLSKIDKFMEKFKYYKSNKPKPSLKEVLSVDIESNSEISCNNPKSIIDDPRAETLGLKSLKEWRTYSFTRHPGLLFISNPFTALGQRYWIRKCLEEYPRKPNKSNLDIEMELPDWWETCFRNGLCDRPLQKKLRWTTLGYHHNWDTKIYTEENKSLYPDDLAELSDVFAKYLGFPNFRAQATIVNNYHMNSTLSAHTDHSEVNLEAPLFSFSFGQSAIFLIGGTDKSVEPSAVLINSGDVVVMSKDARLCYHAVPKILPSSKSPWDSNIKLSSTNQALFKYISQPEKIVSINNENFDNSKWNVFRNYIKESRINMNVRQVLNENQENI